MWTVSEFLLSLEVMHSLSKVPEMLASEFMSQQEQASGIHEEVRVPWGPVKASVAIWLWQCCGRQPHFWLARKQSCSQHSHHSMVQMQRMWARRNNLLEATQRSVKINMTISRKSKRQTDCPSLTAPSSLLRPIAVALTTLKPDLYCPYLCG